MKKSYNAPEFELLDILSENILFESDLDNSIDDETPPGDEEDVWSF